MHHGRQVTLVTTREDVEKAAWAASGWTVDQQTVDELMAAVDAYVAEQLVFLPVVEDATVEPAVSVEPAAAAVTLEPASGGDGGEDAAALDAAGVDGTWDDRGPLEPGDEWKTCRKCGETKSRNANFAPSKSSTTGYLARCRPCMREDRRRYDRGRTK